MEDGLLRPGYERVADTFARLLAEDPGAGAALAVHVDGELVVDVWGGVADHDTREPWTRDTRAIIFSCTKGLLATCAVKAAQDGDLDLDAPIAEYWPEFGSAGKQGVTARMVLAHRAGLSAVSRAFTLREALCATPVVRALEGQAPLWEPGTSHAYHALTYGWLVAEILRRATPHPLGEHLRVVVGDASHEAGLGTRAGNMGTVARFRWDPDRSSLEFPADRDGTPSRSRMKTRAVTLGTAFTPDLVDLNRPDVLAAGVPAVGGVGTARALARIWSRTVVVTGGVPALLAGATVRDATRPLSEGPGWHDSPPPHPRWATGYMLRSGMAPMLSDASFGHDGAGGQLCFADPDAGVGFAFLTNRLRNVRDDRARRLVDALRAALGSGSMSWR